MHPLSGHRPHEGQEVLQVPQLREDDQGPPRDGPEAHTDASDHQEDPDPILSEPSLCPGA